MTSAPGSRSWWSSGPGSTSWRTLCSGGGASLREIALHILDVLENALRAGAGVILVTVEEQPVEDSLRVEVEDDGPGLPVSAEKAVDPFFREGKRTGLGLPL